MQITAHVLHRLLPPTVQHRYDLRLKPHNYAASVASIPLSLWSIPLFQNNMFQKV